MTEAYLDIETTGLSPATCSITVVGIFLVRPDFSELVQLVGDQISGSSIKQALAGASTVYTYNGDRFDLPFIRECTGLDIRACCQRHHDLMFDCWKLKLFGGLKQVEFRLGITREIEGVGGFQAVLLWQRYQQYADEEALGTLLKYNAEDVMNLQILRSRLAHMASARIPDCRTE